MFERFQLSRICGLAIFVCVATAAWSDSIVGVTSQSSQGSNDSVTWAQLGADGKVLPASVSAKSGSGITVNIGFAGPNSLASAVCAASPSCSWSGTGFAAGDRIIWTSDAAAAGNGPVSLAFGTNVSGAGALIQADEPGQFTAEIQAFNGATLLGSFTVASDAAGDAVYIGILDQTGANITSVTFSLTACGNADTNCVLADFALDTVFINVPSGSFALSVTLGGTGSGTVTSSPSGINCPSTCTANFSVGTVVTLTASAASGSTFAGWSGACTGTGTCSVTMSAAKSVTATFNIVTFRLTVTLAGTGSGTVTSSPSGISCPSTCSANFNSGTAVTLTATAASGSTFAGWSGACTGTGTCSVTMSAAKSVTATFNTSGPVLKLSPTSLSFGTVAIGVTSAVKKVTLKNTGTASMTISQIIVTGTNSVDFVKTATTCGASLGIGATCTVSVDFKPTAAGTRSAAISITDNAPGSPQQVSLSGTGTTAKLSPTSLGFGTVTVGTTSAAKTVTFTNVGTTSITSISIGITGTNAGDFLQTNTCGSSLNAGAKCTISVKFKPTVKGARRAAVSVTDSAAGSPQTVSLSGTGG